MGRKTLLTDELIDKLEELVRVGNYIDVACAACGISADAFHNWMRKGRDVIETYGDDVENYDLQVVRPVDQIYARFVIRMQIASAESEAYAVATIRKQMPQQWTAAMTFLERRFPGRWKRRDETTVRSPFDPAHETERVDTERLLADPRAVELLHAALERVALPAPQETIEAEVVEASPPENSSPPEIAGPTGNAEG